MCLEEYFVIYTLKLAIYFKIYENIIVSREQNHLIFEMFENLAGAEFLPVRAFLGFFCKISTPGLTRGRREGGRLGSAKKFKTSFFKRYFKILSRGYSNGSRTSPIFFFFKYLNKYGCQSHPKFWLKWAVAGRLIEQQPKFFSQICAHMR